MFHLSLRWSGHVSSSPWSNASKVTSLYNCSLGPKVFSQFLCLCIRNDDENGSIVRLLMIVARTWRRSNTFTRTLHFAAFPAFFSTDPLYEITISMGSKIFSKQVYISTLRISFWNKCGGEDTVVTSCSSRWMYQSCFQIFDKVISKGPWVCQD